MRTRFPWLAALLFVAATADLTQAYYPYYPYAPQAPSAYGPGYYTINQCGAQYGPHYCVYPPFPPFNGARPNLQRPPQQTPNFPTHPFARGPRDFFMLEQ
jgi:hypothetical protein